MTRYNLKWSIPLNNYLSTLANHLPQDNRHSICHLTDLGLLRIDGREAKKFLQGQLTCHLEEITLTQSRMGAHCNPQGRVLSLFYIFMVENAYYLLMPRSLISIAMIALQKYAVFYQAELTDISTDFIIMGYIGDKKTLEEKNKEAAYTIIQIQDAPVIERYLLIGNKKIMKELEDALCQFAPLPPNQWKHLDLCAGIPAIYPETSTKFLPHEINLDKLGAIHLNKGCYTGQEIIARMHYKAKLKNHLYLAQISNSATLLPGTDIYSLHGEEIKASGMIVDVCLPHNEVLLVTDEANAKNKHLFLPEKNDKNFFTSLARA